jgi:hypothetical protein
MPIREGAVYHGYYNTSPECWAVFTEVLGAEFGNAPLFAQVHQLTVDTYAVQHAGGAHPDKSIFIHLAGLHLVLDRGYAPMRVPPLLQRLARTVREWPHFEAPADLGPMTIFDVALADSAMAHAGIVREWAAVVWEAWSPCRTRVASFVSGQLALE